MYLLGSDYVFPRTANKVIKAQLQAEGGKTVGRGVHAAGQHGLQRGGQQDQGGQTGRRVQHAQRRQQRRLLQAAQGGRLTADNMPVMSVSVAEVEVAGIGVDNFKGQLTAWNYFQIGQVRREYASSSPITRVATARTR